jgi:hypothetical protein
VLVLLNLVAKLFEELTLINLPLTPTFVGISCFLVPSWPMITESGIIPELTHSFSYLAPFISKSVTLLIFKLFLFVMFKVFIKS